MGCAYRWGRLKAIGEYADIVPSCAIASTLRKSVGIIDQVISRLHGIIPKPQPALLILNCKKMGSEAEKMHRHIFHRSSLIDLCKLWLGT